MSSPPDFVLVGKEISLCSLVVFLPGKYYQHAAMTARYSVICRPAAEAAALLAVFQNANPATNFSTGFAASQSFAAL